MWFRYVSSIFVVGLLLMLAPVAASTQTWAELIVHSQRGEPPVIRAEINGKPVRLLLAADAPRFVLLNRGVAERLELRSNPLLSMGVRLDMLGDISRGRTGRARISPEGAPSFRQRLVWFEGIDVAEHADGVIGVAAFEHLDSLIVQFDDPDRPLDAAMNVAMFPGRHGLEWTVAASEGGLPLELRFSFSRPSSVDRAASAALERAGLLATANDDLEFARFWFIDRALAFQHANLALELGGVAPDRFLRFAERAEVDVHRRRIEYEQQLGPIETITVRGSGARGNDDPYQLSLGNDVLLDCWRVEFYFETGAVLLRCPE